MQNFIGKKYFIVSHLSESLSWFRLSAKKRKIKIKKAGIFCGLGNASIWKFDVKTDFTSTFSKRTRSRIFCVPSELRFLTLTLETKFIEKSKLSYSLS